MGLITLARSVLDVVVPPACAGCGLPGPAVCAGCRQALRRLPPPWCTGCGHPWPVAVDRCPECLGPIRGARQAVAYAGPAPAIIGALKDRRRRDLAAPLARLVADAVPRPAPPCVLVPVPLTPARERERGFNQARLLAVALGRLWGLEVVPALERVADAPAQRGAGRTARRRQVAHAFRAQTGPALPARACLVDDVHTTGSTLAACARALRAAGVRQVTALAVARVVRGPGAGGD
jgi:ComF family protein